ncbi:MAG: DUF2336 domain-containing protein [Afipia sp.]|nr:DUF2336 domain-containing protein [Afipia sp.]
MIVRQFIRWVRHAPAGERAEATRALARAWLISDLSQDDRAAAEGALLMLLDDASPLVRAAMADIFARAHDAPPAIVAALATDQPSVALPLLEFSPLLRDADLVDIVATGNSEIQCAIARRAALASSVCAALAEVGSPAAALELIENPDAELAAFSIDRIVERHGHLAAIREALLQRDDLPAATRLALVAHLSATLAKFVTAREWLDPVRAERVAVEAVERSTINIVAETRGEDLAGLIRHLRTSGQLTAGLILRALLCGNIELFERALVELTGLAPHRVSALVHDRGGASLQALLTKAGLPPSTFMAFRAALEAGHEIGFVGSAEGAIRLQRRMVERVLTQCEAGASAAHEPLLILLRRFATEAAREDARLFCDELVADDLIATNFVELISAQAGLDPIEDGWIDDTFAQEADYIDGEFAPGTAVNDDIAFEATYADDDAYDHDAYDNDDDGREPYRVAAYDDGSYDDDSYDAGRRAYEPWFEREDRAQVAA